MTRFPPLAAFISLAFGLAACGTAPIGPPAGVPDANRLAPGYSSTGGGGDE